jgi:hypothetical protein
VLTTSPEAMPSPASARAPSATSASPVVIPIRISSSPCSAKRLADGQRRADGPFRVVLVRDGRPEHRHYGVADELLDCSTEALELGPDARVIGLEQTMDLLGIHALGAGGESDKVAEEACHDLAFLAGRLPGKCPAAPRAEPRVLRVLATARRAGRHGRRIGRP